jgi:hypothetical protein
MKPKTTRTENIPSCVTGGVASIINVPGAAIYEGGRAAIWKNQAESGCGVVSVIMVSVDKTGVGFYQKVVVRVFTSRPTCACTTNSTIDHIDHENNVQSNHRLSSNKRVDWSMVLFESSQAASHPKLQQTLHQPQSCTVRYVESFSRAHRYQSANTRSPYTKTFRAAREAGET